jgi:hypothetical protein
LFKVTVRIAPLLALLVLAGASSAHAQRMISPFFGLGSDRDTVGTDNASVCTSGQLFDNFTGVCEAGPTMGGLFGMVGVDYMLKRKIGLNGEYAFKVSPSPYLPDEGLKMRPSFYDINGFWQPFGKRVAPFLEGGFGGARVSLLFNSNSCLTGSPCGNFTPPASLNFYQLHFAVGGKIYIHGAIFVKPEFDLHYVFNFQPFGRNAVIGYMISGGYTFGRH